MRTDDRFTTFAVAGALLVTIGVFFWSHPGLVRFTPELAALDETAILSTPKTVTSVSTNEPKPYGEPGIVPAIAKIDVASIVFASNEVQSSKNVELYADFIKTITDLSSRNEREFSEYELPDQKDVLVRTNHDGRTVVAAGTHNRYEDFVEAIAGLDVDQVDAVLQEQPEELRIAFANAIESLLATPVTAEDPDMESKGWYWGFADPDYESLSMASKHLLLMGRKNSQIVRTKLMSMRDAFDSQTEFPTMLQALPTLTQIADAQPIAGQREALIAP